jgi:hypothetical protein
MNTQVHQQVGGTYRLGRLLVLIGLLAIGAFIFFSQARMAAQAASSDSQQAATLPEGASPDWWGGVQAQIGRSEYEVSWQERTALPDVVAAYQAPNRTHNLRTYFTPAGIRVVPRTDIAPAWEWSLTLTGYGYAGNMQAPAAAEVAVNGNRVEYQRGMLTEWYVNNERGLEQGFTLAERPLAVNQASALRFELAVGGGLTPNLVEDGVAVELTTAGGVRVLRYDGLVAYDATGRTLPATMGVDGSTIYLSVDDSDAVYPVTIDPLATSPSWTAESDQADAFFGARVNTAGDVNGDGYGDIIISASTYDNGETNEGRAFVYYGSPNGPSSFPDWTAEGNQPFADFSSTVNTAGDVNSDGYADVIIAAASYDNGQTDEGVVYVYHGSASGLSNTPDWMAESNQTSAGFGHGWVSTAGDVNGDGYDDVIIGAQQYDNGQTDEGAAFVYLGSGVGLANTPVWTAEGNQVNGFFGRSVETVGDVNGDSYDDVIVGAQLYDSGETDEGKAFVYYGSPTGPSAVANWSAEGNQSNAHYGESAKTAGDVNGDGYADVIVGATLYSNGDFEEGRAYVYYGSANGLNASPNWTGESNQFMAHYGRDVSPAGDLNGDGYADVAVGAFEYDNGESEEGRVYVYFGSATGLNAVAGWTAEGNQSDAKFGHSSAGVDINGDGYSDLLVGAYRYDNGQANEGRAFIYLGASDGLSTVTNWSAESNQNNAEYGVEAGTAGDVNGDGYADLIVGAHKYDNGQTDEGAAFVFYGSPSGLSGAANWFVDSNQAGAWFGHSVTTAGDVNGDGYSDVIIGSPRYTNGQAEEGRAFVYYGSASGLSMTPAWFAESNQATASLGGAVSTAGDVNGDGYADVLVGANSYDNGQIDEGTAYVYHGSPSGLSATPNWTGESNQASADFGFKLSGAGDVNGDGFSDIIVGARFYDNGQVDEGAAFVYHGSSTGLSLTPNWLGDSNQASALLGPVTGAGDVNGDGFSDVVVGAYWYNGGQFQEGRAFGYYGSAAGLSLTPNWTVESNQSDAFFGIDVGSAGDVNGDGYADALVGAFEYDNGTVDEGAAFLYLGSASGLSSTSNWMTDGNNGGSRYGGSVNTAGDINGDGYADPVVTARLFSNGQTEEGKVFLYYGNGSDGMDIRPRQMRTDGTVHIAPLGLSDDETSVQLRLTGRTPLGRDQVKLEWQVAPLGTPFTATTGVISGTSSSWTDVLTTGVELVQNVEGLTPETPYHWRVRLVYEPGNRLGQSTGRWIHIPWNAWTEQDFRTPAEPGNLIPTQIYIGPMKNGRIGSLVFSDEDILLHDIETNGWSIYLDMSDVGLGLENIDAFDILEDGSVLFSTQHLTHTIPGFDTVEDSDIIKFIPTSTGQNTAGSFEWYFDGSDVGLTTNAEDVDVVDVTEDGKVIISTYGNVAVPGVSGLDEDLLIFTPTSLGSNTSGTWAMYFDGSDVELSTTNYEDINDIWINSANGDIYLTTLGVFSVTGASGTGADIFICTPSSLGNTTACTYSMFWVALDHGFPGMSDGIVLAE